MSAASAALLVTVTGLEVRPGPQSFFRNGQMVEGPARLEFKSDRLVSITASRQYDRLEDLLA